MKDRTIIQNEAQCARCETIIFSGHRHHYSECRCGAIAVDGGMGYLRRTGDRELIRERSLSLPTEQLDRLRTQFNRAVGRYAGSDSIWYDLALDATELLLKEGLLLREDKISGEHLVGLDPVACGETLSLSAESGRNNFGLLLAMFREARDQGLLDESQFR